MDGRYERALKRYRELVSFYERQVGRNRVLWYTLQSAALILGSLTPVLLLWSSLPTALQALPAALAVIATGLTNIIRPRESWARTAFVREALKREHHLFDMRCGERYARDLSEADALDRFIAEVESIGASEVADWKALRKATEDLTVAHTRG